MCCAGPVLGGPAKDFLDFHPSWVGPSDRREVAFVVVEWSPGRNGNEEQSGGAPNNNSENEDAVSESLHPGGALPAQLFSAFLGCVCCRWPLLRLMPDPVACMVCGAPNNARNGRHPFKYCDIHISK